MGLEKKRILIVNGQTMNKANATGITLRSIVRQIPIENVLEVFRYQPENTASDAINIRRIQIPPKSMPVNYFSRKLMRLDNYREKTQNGQQNGATVNTISKKGYLKLGLKAMIEQSPIIADREFLRQIDGFSPNVVYTMGGDFYVHKWALYFAKRYDIPIVMHYMDNWRETSYTNGKCVLWIKRMLDRQLEKIEARMDCGLVISQAMADAYQAKYHHEYKALMNTVPQLKISSIAHSTLNFVYAGGLHVGRHKSLHILAEFACKIESVRVIVYTSVNDRNMYEALYPNDNVIFKSYVPHERMNEVFEEADVMLHIESFDERVIEFTRYSLSTKIPEYMASGRPILCYAPQNIASYQYISETDCGVCISDESELSAGINELTDIQHRNYYGENGKKNAAQRHSNESMIETLKYVLRKI